MRRCCRRTTRFVHLSSPLPLSLLPFAQVLTATMRVQLGFERDEAQLKKNNEDHTKWSNVGLFPPLSPFRY